MEQEHIYITSDTNFQPGLPEWREAFERGLRRLPPLDHDEDTPDSVQTAYALGWSVAITRLEEGFDEI